MSKQTGSSLRRVLGNRTAVAAAGAVGFVLGAGGFVAAQNGPDDLAPVTAQVATSVDDTSVDTSLIAPSSSEANIPDTTPETTGDASSSSVANSLDDASSDDASSSSVPNSIDDASSSSVANSIDDASSDDASSSSVANSIDDDAASTSVAAPAALPAPFTETYQSSGGTITVTWSGAAFSISSISPAVGFEAEIEDNSWDKVRVDFENGSDDSRIEVRLHDRQIRVRID